MGFRRAMLMECLQVIFRGNANAMLQMFRKHTGYNGSNDFINNCNEQEADIFIRKYRRSFENCKALQR